MTTITTKNGKVKLTTDFTVLEEALAKAEKGALAVWIKVHNAYEAEHAVTGVSKSQFAEAWNKQFPKRTASTIRINLSYVSKAAESYDLSTFEDMAHLVSTVNPKQASGATAAKKSTFDKVRDEIDDLSTAELRKLLAMVQSRLGIA